MLFFVAVHIKRSSEPFLGAMHTKKGSPDLFEFPGYENGAGIYLKVLSQGSITVRSLRR